MAERVAVVIVHYKRRDLTQRCVASARASTHNNICIEVVDNDEVNRGFAGGANVGIRAALADPEVKYIFVLNNDAWLTPNAMREVLQVAESTGAGMVAPVVLKTSDKSIDRIGLRLNSAWLGFNKEEISGQPALCPSGCAALYSRELLEAVAVKGEYFDEDFFMYGEDTDLGLRAQALGFHCAIAERAKIFHEGSASAPDVSLPMYLGHRNNVWYIAKNISFKHWYQWPAILAGQVASLARLTLRGDWKVIWKAKYEALKGLPRMWRKGGKKT